MRTDRLAAVDRDPRPGQPREWTFLRHGRASDGTHMDWMSCAERLTEAECDGIIGASRQFELVPPAVVGEERLPGHRRADTRMLTVTEDTAWLFEVLLSIADQATEQAYRLALSGITRSPQYVEYRPGWGEFGWHNDYSHGMPAAPRKLTVIFQLSEPSDYVGGLLQVMGTDIETAPRERGSIIVFPSILMHRVTPVTDGIRCALVAWIAGPRHE